MIIYREPTTLDAEGILNYLYDVAGETDNLSMGQDDVSFTINEEIDFIQQNQMNPNRIMILAMDDKKIVGLLTIIPLGRKRLAHRGDLGITVRKEYWRQGIGQHLMEQGLARAMETPNIESIYLEVVDGNDGAYQLYEKMGFQLLGTIQKSVKIIRKGETEYMNLHMMQRLLDK